jgi:mediator of RNA polymerase II transcription subunit 14
MQSLHIKITPAIAPQEMKPIQNWNHEDLQALETYFEQKVAAPPYRQASLYGFTKMFNVPQYVLRDLIQIIKLEMKPELCKSMGLHFNVQLSLRATFSNLPIIPLGTAAVVNTKNKLLLFVS